MANPFATEGFRLSNLNKAELWDSKGYCRNVVTVNEATAKEYLVGTVLGRVISGATATAVAGSGNTGDGAMGAITVAAPAMVGEYRLVIIAAATNAGTFLVSDPKGVLVGSGTVGSAFSAGGLTFTLADGAADFVVGDSFTITVVGSYKYKIAVETATDGSRTPDAVVIAEYSVAATTDTKVLVMEKGPAVLSKGALELDASFNDDTKKAFAYAALDAKGINVDETV